MTDEDLARVSAHLGALETISEDKHRRSLDRLAQFDSKATAA